MNPPPKLSFSVGAPPSPWNDREPIRAELFSLERLEEHGRSLAAAQPVSGKKSRGLPLADRLADNEAVLLRAHRATAKAIAQGGAITPAAEWLIDNYYVVEKQIREIRLDLPPGYYRELPKLTDGPLAGYPRVFGVAWAFVAHTDSRFDAEGLCRFARAYQEVQPLTIGELWAVAITLRIVLIENLRRLAERIVLAADARDRADRLADRLLGFGQDATETVDAVLAAQPRGPLLDAFAVQLAHRLRDQDPRISPALNWLEQKLAARGGVDAVVRDEHQRQGAGTVTIRNIVTSMRLISDVDWADLVERISLVDDVLGGDAFRAMDFPTRNLYRTAVQELSRGSGQDELYVAQAAVAAARAAPAVPSDDPNARLADPGYYLLAAGRRALENELGYRPTLADRAWRLNQAVGIGGYGGAVILLTAILIALPLIALGRTGLSAPWLVLPAFLGLVPAMDAAVALVNFSVTSLFGAKLLPALELRDGVPSDLRTVVAVPALLADLETVEELIERLEVHHLASPEGDLHFALLSDWLDADAEAAESDGELLEAASQGIARLNRLYGPGPGGQRFLLLHRRRVWNAGEGRWIGWERKRGKLHELNRLLRGATDTTFIPVDGAAPSAPSGARYVITLDSDTRLPRETVRRLIGKMAHPLNRPRLDPVAGRIVEGYGVLQPRVTPSLPVGSEGSAFQRVFSSVSGIDPYASAVSDVYQDLFGEGSFTGKGIYDIDAFEAALGDRAPDSTMLSHDLFEGVFARAGFASDVEVVEEFPARYAVSAKRQHRWARGDWQLLPWILGRGPAIPGPRRGGVPPVGRWKMLDNLRRSMSAPVAVAALLAGWAAPPGAAFVWTLFVLLTITAPALIPILGALGPGRPGLALRSRLRTLTQDVETALSLSAFTVVLLADQAWLMGDAIVRTLYRLLVSRRHLLEWTPAAQAASGSDASLAGSYRRMGGAVVIGAVALAIGALEGRGALVVAAPFAILWFVSPAIARWASRPVATAGRMVIGDGDARVLRLIARRTWRFFETFVTSTDNMLPPDNFQEDPAEIVAHRTSPTNIGLYLLSVASARDFGWVGTREAIERLEATFHTLDRLSRYRGHFYNWYDTKDLRTLDPPYISSVDSGNLAGHLIALANACREWRERPVDVARRIAGVSDALDLAREEAAHLSDGRRTQTVTRRQLQDALALLTTDLRRPMAEGEERQRRFGRLALQAQTCADIAAALAIERGDGGADLSYWVEAAWRAIESHRLDLDQAPDAARAIEARLTVLEEMARAMALSMEFGFLLDPDRKLLSIGYLPSEGRLDPSCYDLLASEARLASFFAIAKGDIPARHWFHLGRTVTPVGQGAAMVSWSGSMFEYLMPSLVMRAPAGSLIEQTNRLIVRRQIEHGADLGVPWGVSESAYNARDLEFTYQYSNFGVPGLGLKRGLGENAVIAPYATVLATMIDPRAAVRNLARLEGVGARGRFGFYEALDYTPARLPEDSKVAIVRAFMAHHQGMSVVAIADALLDGRMRDRFHEEPMVQATELLLQERTPRDVPLVRPWAAEVKSAAKIRELEASGARWLTTPHDASPATHLLSNGRYAVMLTAAGSGYSRWRDIAVTRWREDATRDDLGAYVYFRDVGTGEVWSAGFQPSGIEPFDYGAYFSEDHAEIVRRDGALGTTMEVVVSAEDDAEVRRVSVANSSSVAREIEITSYAELVLTAQATDIAHPAFAKMFVETEFLPGVDALLATRRRRTPDEGEIWAAHLAVVDGEVVGKPQVETDRARFLGRGGGVREPIAMMDGRPLSNTTGAVLDPIFALRQRVRVPARGKVRVAFWTLVAGSREALLDMIDRHRDVAAYERAATLAWTQAQVQLHHLSIDRMEASLFQRLAGHLIYASPTFRSSSDIILRGGGGQPGLWSQGISGDLPILLLRISEIENLDIVRQLLRAHEYWRLKQLAVDLVIINDRASSYVQDLQNAIESLVRTHQQAPAVADPGAGGRVYTLRSDLVSDELRALLPSVARVVLVAERGRMADQLDRVAELKPAARPAPRSRLAPRDPTPASVLPPGLEFFNGLGGFADDGREYVTVLGPGQSTPAPWINVIANPDFGFQVSAEGSGYTWAVNSRENQLTPWSNDPVTDPSAEAIYLRDEDTGDLWSPTARPIRSETGVYTARHGRGCSRFEHTANGVASDLVQYVPMEGSIKISRLKLRNTTNRPRRISVAAYAEWVLGPSRTASAAFVTTQIDPATGALFARNPWNPAFAARIAFLDMAGRQSDWTGDRREFIGRNGGMACPAALSAAGPLSNTVGAGFDPCGALRATLEIAPHGSVELDIFLGEAADADEARTLITRYRAADLDAVRAEVKTFWDQTLDQLQVKTPDRSMDIMLNGWLLYQTLACRIWARSAFYQASGAYGFRDQLQDGMAITATRPAQAREHLLRAAGRQFPEGDVQHWWLPHSGQGVRTRISDDRAWLAYIVAHYVNATGDAAVLNEQIPFLEAPPLKPEEADDFSLPKTSERSATLFEHCALALDQSLAVGAHGLPLMGSGDWNDGMNRIGAKGRGESVWLAWLLHATLMVFAPFSEARRETVRAATWRAHAAALKVALEREAWDGEWYMRGFYDDGSPLGSAKSDECRIDSIAQSWAVISGAADGGRAQKAMAEVEQRLIKPADGVALLFDPPFDKTPLDPGYIKGYPPGLRENGGQYTHAATWSVIALALLGDGDKAAELFALLNPINHAKTRADVHRYKVEPYVVAADVYSVAPHVGRGGWTWYTGSAGWLYRSGVESILGLQVLAGVLHVDPCIPKAWPGFSATLRHGSSRYEIQVENPDGVERGIASAELDGTPLTGRPVRAWLADDGAVHRLVVRMGG